MKTDLTRLINHFIEEILIEEKIMFNEEYYKNTDIRRLDEVEVRGSISSTTDNLYNLSINVKGNMILPCSITLEDVSFPFDIRIEEILNDNDEQEEKYVKIINNSIDIMPIIWQNIVMEIPLKVVSPKASTHMIREGDGWRLITDEERNSEIDPRLASLSNMLDE